MRTKRVVVDASYVMSWLLPDEKKPKIVAEHKVAPELLPFEVVNALRSAVKQRRIDEKLAGKLLQEFVGWRIELQKVSEQEILRVAIANNISGYDASYVMLAKKLGVELLTWDKRLGGIV